VRELRNLVHRRLILGGEEEIGLGEVEQLLAAEASAGEPLVKQDLLALPLREAREQFERAYLQQQLQLCEGKVGQLAKRVGMERTHLYRKLRSLGIDFRQAAGDD
jgi:DNA-binding NtrC family response regulator